MKGKIEELRCGDVQGFAIRSGIKAGLEYDEEDPLAVLVNMPSTLSTRNLEAGGSIRA